MWIKKGAPASVLLAGFIVDQLLIFGLIFFTVISCLASGIAGFAVFRKRNVSMKKLTLLGLFNFFSIIGFSIAVLFMKTRKIPKNLKIKKKD